ncbi:MAG: undecaprenyl-diphosphate phosphatase, partial [Verrucomicrobiae bacterium]|nr:undecaprenyl-diphosphate phosphatase [Verrucomicrobiae bacterium]
HLESLILGLIEGITEFLPVSSTGHLLIAGHFLSPRSDVFNVFIQTGAVLAVLIVFTQKARDLVLGWKKPEHFDYLLKLAVCFGITGLGGIILKKAFHFELPTEMKPVAWATFLGGVAILIIEALVRKRKLTDDLTWTVVVVIALGQLIAAVFPGASRSGTTILLALMFGLSRPKATEFSFLVGIPTLLAAGGLELFAAIRQDELHSRAAVDLGIGFVAAAVSAFIVVRWLLRFIQTHTFVIFGWYRILAGAVLLWMAYSGV